jgi:hypothetical protein
VSKTSRAAQASERRARLLELQRAQRAKERRRRLTIVGAVAFVVVVVAVVVVVTQTGSSSKPTSVLNISQEIIPSTPTGKETVEQTPAQVPSTVPIKGLLSWSTVGWPGDGASHPGALEHAHVPGPVKYAVLPPVGGPHNATWMNAGVYTKPVPSERAVHNLEHGAVWITYNPDLPKAQIALLVAFVGRQSMIPENEPSSPGQENRYVDLSPWATNSLPSPIVISSWGYQLRVNSPTDPRLQVFVDTFRHNAKYTPEFGAAVDGIPIETGGRPAAYGSKNPNPAGAVKG